MVFKTLREIGHRITQGSIKLFHRGSLDGLFRAVSWRQLAASRGAPEGRRFSSR